MLYVFIKKRSSQQKIHTTTSHYSQRNDKSIYSSVDIVWKDIVSLFSFDISFNFWGKKSKFKVFVLGKCVNNNNNT